MSTIATRSVLIGTHDSQDITYKTTEWRRTGKAQDQEPGTTTTAYRTEQVVLGSGTLNLPTSNIPMPNLMPQKQGVYLSDFQSNASTHFRLTGSKVRRLERSNHAIASLPKNWKSKPIHLVALKAVDDRFKQALKQLKKANDKATNALGEAMNSHSSDLLATAKKDVQTSQQLAKALPIAFPSDMDQNADQAIQNSNHLEDVFQALEIRLQYQGRNHDWHGDEDDRENQDHGNRKRGWR